MKRLLPLLLMMLLFLAPALAEDDPTALFLEAHPGYEIMITHPEYGITAADVEGDIAAAILTNGTEKVLCIAERVNGQWTQTIDTAKALNQDEAYNYHLYVSPDDPIVYWERLSSDTCVVYSARLKNGVWTVDSPCFKNAWGDDFREIELMWGNGQFRRIHRITDENGNILSTKELLPLPASWMDSMTALENFDESQLPTFYSEWWPTKADDRAIAEAAKELLPGYTLIGGSVTSRDELQLLMDRPDGARVFIGVIWDNGWQITESTPMPADTRYGAENFTNYLYMPDQTIIGLRHWAGGTWGVNRVMPDSGDLYHLGQHYFSNEYTFLFGGPSSEGTLLIGDSPWADITTINWTTLPHSIEEAAARINSSDWAMVNNPNPEDRLHLRVKADRDSASQGKYYNGTFVRVLERGKTWTKVDVFGVEGWMMTQYLAFGDDMQAVHHVTNHLFVSEILRFTTLYDAPGGKAIDEISGDVLVLGIVGDEWYHVWVDDEETGYVRQEDLWAGNG